MSDEFGKAQEYFEDIDIVLNGELALKDGVTPSNATLLCLRFYLSTQRIYASIYDESVEREVSEARELSEIPSLIMEAEKLVENSTAAAEITSLKEQLSVWEESISNAIGCEGEFTEEVREYCEKENPYNDPFFSIYIFPATDNFGASYGGVVCNYAYRVFGGKYGSSQSKQLLINLMDELSNMTEGAELEQVQKVMSFLESGMKTK